MTTVIYIIMTLIVAYIFANAIVRNNNERIRREKLERKLDKEDWILHDLTACDED